MGRKDSIVKIILLFLCVSLLLQGCGKQTVGDRVFEIDRNCLTDGELYYKWLPDQWDYHGTYPFKIGKVQRGNALYASDRNGTIVQEAKHWYQDMDYRPWILENAEVPDKPGKRSDVLIEINREESFYLSENARAEFMAWYLTYDSEIIGKTETKYYAQIYPAVASVPGLIYKEGYRIVLADSLYITDHSGNVCEIFESDTALFQEITEHIREDRPW